jgi:hypothetical protein
MAPRRRRMRRSKRVAEGAEHLTPDFIQDQLTMLGKRDGDRDGQIRELRELRFMEDKDPNEVPENLRASNPALRLYTAGTYVENEVGALTTLPPTVRLIQSPNASIEDRERYEKIERFLPALWRRMELDRGRDTKRNLFDQAVADGEGVLKGIYKPTVWQAMPGALEFMENAPKGMDDETASGRLKGDALARYHRAVEDFVRNSALPIAVRTVDPLSAKPIWGDTGLDVVIEDSRRPLLSVGRLAGPFGGMPLSRDDADPSPMVRVVEYWDRDFMAVYMEATRGGGQGSVGRLKLIGAVRHELGRIPYWFVHGQETSSTDRRYESISTLFKVKDGIPAFHRVLNQYLTIVRQKAYATFQQKKSQMGPTDAASEPAHVKLVPGSVMYVDDAIDDPFIRAIQWPDAEVNLPVLMNLLLGLSDASQLGAAATGGGSFSGESGFLRAQLVDLARVGYHQIIEHGENAFSGFYEWVLWIIQNRLKRTLYAEVPMRDDDGNRRNQWLGIGPEEIQGEYGVRVRITPFNPVMDIPKGQHAANMVNAKLYPKRWALENVAGVENAQELVDELLLDELMEDPVLRQALRLREMRRAGLVELAASAEPVNQAEAAALAAMGGDMGGPAAGTPQVPGVGAPVSGPANAGGGGQVL